MTLIQPIIAPPQGQLVSRTVSALSSSALRTISAYDGIVYLDCSYGSFEVFVPPGAMLQGWSPVLLARTDAVAGNYVEISDGTKVVDQITTPAGVNGAIGGFRLVTLNANGLVCYGAG